MKKIYKRRGRGRPNGSVKYFDDDGNPIGIYEHRKLQKEKKHAVSVNGFLDKHGLMAVRREDAINPGRVAQPELLYYYEVVTCGRCGALNYIRELFPMPK